MRCPECGGSDREPIAPGLWRCTSRRIETVLREGPGFGHPNPSRGPPVIPAQRSVTCGAEYQEGAPTTAELACGCGTFAIGRCAECGDPVCGTHSAVADGRRLCSRDMARVREAFVEAERERKARLADAAAHEHDQKLEQIAALDDPIERLLSALAFVLHDLHPDDVGASAAQMSQRRRSEFARACPESDWEGTWIDNWDMPEVEGTWVDNWDTQEIGDWLVRRMRATGVEPNGTFRETAIHQPRFGKARTVEIATHRAWSFPLDLRGNASGDAVHGDSGNHLGVLEDGRMTSIYVEVGDLPRVHGWDGTPGGRVLTPSNLVALARAVGLPPVEIRRSLPG